MSEYLAEMFIHQHGFMDVEVWMEPFAGGAGAGLTLLDAGVVDSLWLVEKNPALAALWRSICDRGAELAARVESTVPTITLWRQVQEVVAAAAAGDTIDDLELGYAAFIVNRCSRSGICAPNVGPIGGMAQRGRWTIGSRFHSFNLAQRLRHIHALSSRITICEGDGTSYIDQLAGSGVEDEVMILADPPYIREGARLYTHSFDWTAHNRLAEAMRSTPARWILTYDDEPAVYRCLYPGHRVLRFTIPNTAGRAHTATELAVFADHTEVDPSAVPLTPGTAHWIRWDGADTSDLTDQESGQLVLEGL